MNEAQFQGTLPSEAPWTRINVIVGKQNVMDALTKAIHSGSAVYPEWGNFHHSEQKTRWTEVKANACATPNFKHFYFVHNLECIVAALEVFGPDDGLSLHRAQFRKGEAKILEVVSYDHEMYRFATGVCRESEDSTVLEFR